MLLQSTPLASTIKEDESSTWGVWWTLVTSAKSCCAGCWCFIVPDSESVHAILLQGLWYSVRRFSLYQDILGRSEMLDYYDIGTRETHSTYDLLSISYLAWAPGLDLPFQVYLPKAKGILLKEKNRGITVEFSLAHSRLSCKIFSSNGRFCMRNTQILRTFSK